MKAEVQVMLAGGDANGAKHAVGTMDQDALAIQFGLPAWEVKLANDDPAVAVSLYVEVLLGWCCGYDAYRYMARAGRNEGVRCDGIFMITRRQQHYALKIDGCER